MLLTTDHLLALDTLAASEAAGHALYTIAEDAHTQNLFRVLELQGLVVPEAVQSYRLTYLGYEVLRLLGKMQAAGLLPRNDAAGEYPQLKAGWRFLSSEVLAALEAASRNGGRVGPLTEELLSMRGFTEAETSHDEEQQRSSLRLNMHGEAWLSFARRARPQLEINGDLAHAIQHMNPGYTDMHQLGMRPEHLALLEAMELLSWSVPDGEFATLTALGWAVYEAVLKGGYATADVVLDEPILDVLAFVEKRGKASLTSEQLGELQNLATYATRFDIDLLTDRLLLATRWLQGQPGTQQLAIGYFGASTGAAAALKAAAALGSSIGAVVSRGGRPDLAEAALAHVQSPTLLIVGGNDEVVLQLNREAFVQLPGTKQLVIVPGATHLFEEPGALEEVARLATEWFKRYLHRVSSH